MNSELPIIKSTKMRFWKPEHKTDKLYWSHDGRNSTLENSIKMERLKKTLNDVCEHEEDVLSELYTFGKGKATKITLNKMQWMLFCDINEIVFNRLVMTGFFKKELK